MGSVVEAVLCQPRVDGMSEGCGGGRLCLLSVSIGPQGHVAKGKRVRTWCQLASAAGSRLKGNAPIGTPGPGVVLQRGLQAHSTRQV